MVITREEIVLIKGKRSKRPRPLSPSPLALTTMSSSDQLTRVGGDEDEEEDMANCLILLAKGRATQKPEVSYYSCKTCDKSFSSFQALGGHRASHTKSPIKTVLLADDSDSENTMLSLKIPSVGSKKVAVSVRVHECSLCGAEFSSGQALGGHMRRHRPLPTATMIGGHKKLRTVLSLDLNLPAPEEQVIVFNASSLVDCHY